MLREVYGDFPHHKDGLHLDVVESIWQRRWSRIAAHSASWYATPTGAFGRRITSILAVEWQGVIDRSWDSEKPLVTRHMELWERGLHAGLAEDDKAEGANQEGRAASGREKEEEAMARSYHNMVLSGNLR